MPIDPVLGLPLNPDARVADKLAELDRRLRALERGPSGILAAELTDSVWINVGAAGAPAFQNGWVNFGGGEAPASYYRDRLGIVHFRGLIKSGPTNSVVFTLPVGYRPGGGTPSYRFLCGASGAAAEVYVNGAGNVVMFNGATTDVDLSPVSFRAEA